MSRLVTSNNLNAEEGILDTVIKSLIDMEGKPLSLRDHMEREQAWIDLLNGNKLQHLGLEQLLEMAMESKCYKVAENIYEKQKNYSNILTCYLRDKVRQPEVFNYIVRHVDDSERCIEQQFSSNFKQLINIDSKKTAEIVMEHYAELIQSFCEILDSDLDLFYKFLSEIIYFSEVKLPPHVAENYLKLLCVKNPASTYNYVKLNLCRMEEALKITQESQMHAATAWLLEQSGDFQGALSLLLENNMTESALGVCIRGSEHLDAEGAQQVWFRLLKEPTIIERISMRELLHSAAPHVPPAQLLELVTDANLGDIKILIQGMLTDCQHDKQMLNTTLKLLSCDLHQGEFYCFSLFIWFNFL